MMLSYSFQPEFNMAVWALFDGCESIQGDLYPLEVLRGIASGEVKVNSSFNLRKYIARVEKNDAYETYRHGKRELAIVDDVDAMDGQEDVVTYDIASVNANQIDFAEKFADDDELKYAVSEVNRMSRELFVNFRCDIRYCIRQAMRGIPESIEILRSLVDEYPLVGENLMIILGSGKRFDDLFPNERG